jgi:hypothetical protein
MPGLWSSVDNGVILAEIPTVVEAELARRAPGAFRNAVGDPGRCGRSAEPVVFQDPSADDHLLDVRGALADEQHRGLAVEALDLVLLGEPVPAVDAEGVLDDVPAVLRREVVLAENLIRAAHAANTLVTPR